MSEPNSRQTFIDTCKRRLGEPVVKINVTEEQIDDRVDQALKYYYDFHFSGSELEYYKFQMTANNRADRIYDCTVSAGGTGYSNSDVVVFTVSTGGGTGAAASIVTDVNGVITACTLTDNGDGYAIAPAVSVTSGTGSGAVITSELGGFIPIPENIIGAIRLFPIGHGQSSTSNMFNIRYQIALNDLYTLTSNSIVPYYSAFQHIRLLEEILVGQKPIRYNRHKNRMYVDMDWNVVNDGTIMIAECYKIVDPNEYTDVWKDHWLIKYCTALVKQQWGNNLKKFQGTMLPGNISVNGQQIYDEAAMEIDKLEQDMVYTYSLPSAFFTG